MKRALASALAASSAVVPAVALASTADGQALDPSSVPTSAAPRGISLEEVNSTKLVIVRARAANGRRRAAATRARKRAHRLAAKQQAAGTASPALQAIAACESGGNPSAVGGGGTFRGKYQFDQSTWASVGGAGDPAAAPAAEQDRRARMLYAREGSTPWPVCGR